MISRQELITVGRPVIRDVMPLKIIESKQVISEGIGGVKRMTIRLGGQFQYAGRPNANGRIYPKDVLQEAIGSLQNDIKNRMVMGELDHPADSKIHMDRVSHLITRLTIEENGSVYGELEILKGTIMGDQLAALIENKVTVGISSRGVGDLEDVMSEGQTYQKVLPGYSLVTFDIVGDPSVDGSYLSVLESKGNKLKVKTRKDAEKDLVEEVKNAIRKNVLRG